MSIQETTKTRGNGHRKFGYLALSLLFLALLVVFSGILSDARNNTTRSQLLGTWVVPTGNTVTLRPDGTALDRRADGSSVTHYRWSLADKVVSFWRIRNRQSLMKSVDDFLERLVGDSGVESYRIVDLREDSLTLIYQQNNATSLWIRVDELDLTIQD